MAGRPGRHPFKQQERDRRYQTIVENARQNPWGTIHKLPIPFDDATVKRHENLLWAEARYQGLGRKVTKTRNQDGTWTLSFQLWPLEQSRQFVADRARRTGELHYNARRRKGK